MQTKRIADLSKGDQIALDNGVGTITKVERCPIIEMKGDLCYEVEWTDKNGETGRALQGGHDEVQLTTP
jgi:hypothetical protein